MQGIKIYSLRFFICLWVFLCLSSLPTELYANLKSQSKDTLAKQDTTVRFPRLRSLNTGSTFYYYDHALQTSVPYFKAIDTGLWMVQRFNPVYGGPDFRADRGSLGMPDQLIEYELRDDIGFSYGVDPFASWRYTLENTPFYQTKRAYTLLKYENNFGKEDLFSVLHSQNVAQGLNLTIDYEVLKMPDNKARYFKNSKTLHHHLRFYGNYFSKNGKYKALFGYIRNSITVGENGGMVQDSLYTKNIETNRLLIPVNLQDATRAWKENTAFLKQSYHFAKDKGDSLHPDIHSYGFLMHTFELNEYKSIYTDHSSSLDSFYTHYYINANSTQDTNRVIKISNTLLYSSSDFENVSKSFPIQFLAGLRNEYIQVKDMVEKDAIVQWFPFAEMRLSVAKKFLLDVYYEQALWGYNAGNFLGFAQFSYLFKDEYNNSFRDRDGIRLKVGIKQEETDWVKQRYFSNHFYFNTNFAPEKEFYGELQFKAKGWEFLAGYYLKNDYVMLLKEGPKQVDQSFFIAKAMLAKNFIFGWFGWENRLLAQYVSNQKYAHLPVFCLKETVYGIIPIKDITRIHVGFDIYYNTSYYADAYMPALGMYYWQDEIRTGNYMIIDFFLNFQVKTANIFVRVSHLNQGLFGYNTIATPHYGLAGRAVQFGLTWRLMD